MAHKKEHHEEHSHAHHAKMAKHHLGELHKMAKGHHKKADMAGSQKQGHKQSTAARMDESLGMRRGKESTKSQSMASRRHESKGAKGK